MPFHYRLLGKDRMALYSFIQSLNTTFGTSIYEPAAIALAEGRFAVASSQVTPHKRISSDAQTKIQEIMDQLTGAETEPNKGVEIEKIRKVCRSGQVHNVKLTKVDIWLQTFTGEIFMIDIKTAKPNITGFQAHKRTLLEWAASEMERNPNVEVHSLIGIPYNPYEPEPYQRWTIRGMLDLKHELLVADELWDFIGGDGAYQDLLDCFEQAGIELRPEIDEYFDRFNNKS
jgi:type II restriction enzyme